LIECHSHIVNFIIATAESCYCYYFFKSTILLLLPVLIVFLVFLSSLVIPTIITTVEIQAFAQNTTVINTEQQEPEPKNSEEEAAVMMVIVAIIILSGVAIWELVRRRKKQKVKRQYFTELTKKQVLNDQNYKCAICKKRSEVWDYDHIDGNRSNNDPENCQALCPSCHAKKTRGLIIKQQKAKLYLVTWQIAIRVVVGILLFFIILGTIMYYFVNYIY
jgi:ABC-type nickel/cobalt efflux system permease component RcnA